MGIIDVVLGEGVNLPGAKIAIYVPPSVTYPIPPEDRRRQGHFY
jgi:hypothetical protein